jgi:hypothetical protein
MKNNSSFITHHSSFACLRATHRQAAGVGIPFETKMSEMSQTLYAQMDQAKDLDKTITDNLNSLGYGRK